MFRASRVLVLWGSKGWARIRFVCLLGLLDFRPSVRPFVRLNATWLNVDPEPISRPSL